MKLISHRGNINGRIPMLENIIGYIDLALKKQFDVEVDVWWFNGKLFLGHDGPEMEVTIDYLKNPKLWCHAKNAQALREMIDNNVHCFYHDTDACTLTSRGYIWTYPGKPLVKNSIAVLPERHYSDLSMCLGICSDFIETYQCGL